MSPVKVAVDVTVTETAEDGTVSTEVVSVDITQVENPTVVAGTVDTDEGSTYTASDERFEVVNGQLQMKAGETFVAGESGTVDVTVTETAEDGTVSTEVVSVDITQVENSRTETLNEQAVAENPTVVAGTVDTDEGSTYTASDERFEVVNGQLQMKAGETFVAGESGTVDVTVTETAEDGTVSTEVVSVDITQVESSRTETLNEQAVAENPTVVAGTVETDEGSTYTASDERFEVVNGQLQMKAGETFVAGESGTVDVTVTETAEDGTVSTEVVTVDIDTVSVSRANTETTNNELSSPSVIAGTVNIESGTTYTASDNRFEVVNGNLRIKAGAEFLAGETSPLVVEVKGVDGSNSETSQSVSVNIEQIAEAREVLTSPAVVAGTVSVADGYEYSASDSRFEMVDGQLQLKAGEDFVIGETGTIDVVVTGTNSANEKVEHTIQVDVEAVKASRHEEALPAVGIESVQTDSGNTYSTSDDRFEVVDGELQLKAGRTFIAGETGTLDIVVTGENANGDATLQTIQVDIAQVQADRSTLVSNYEPSASDQTFTINEDSTYQLSESDFGFNDIDGDELQFVEIKELPSDGILELNNVPVIVNQQIQKSDLNKVTFKPDNNENGADYASVKFVVSDGKEKSDIHSLTFNVDVVNDAAVTTQVDLGSTDEDTAIVITEAQLLANATDVEGDTLTVNNLVLSDGSQGSLSDNGDNTWTFTPAADFNGNGVALTYNVNDGTVDTPASAILDVLAINDAPDVTAPALVQLDFTWAGGSLRDFAGSYTFPEDYQLGESIWLARPGSPYIKAVQIEVTENDSGTLTVKTLQAKYTETSVWDGLTEAEQATYLDTSGISYPVATSDDETGYGIKDISINGGETVSGFVDNLSGTDVDINVNHLYLRVDENSPDGTVVGQLSATDAENDTPTFSLTDDAGGRFAIDASTGEISVADGSLLDHEAQASHSVTVQVDDGNGGITEKSYTLTVNDISEAAVIGGTDTAIVTEDDAATLTASGALTVADDDAGEAGFTAEMMTGTYGSLTIDADGNWNYSADNSQSAIQALGDGDSLLDTLVVESLDGTTHTIEVAINGVNDAAVTTQVDLGSTNEDTAIVITKDQLLANATDVDGDTLSVNSLALADSSHGTLVDNGDDTWTFTLAADFNGNDVEFTYNVNDGTVDVSGSAIVDVLAVNDAPDLTADSDSGNASNAGVTITGATSVLENDSDVEGDSLAVSDVNGTAVSGSTVIAGDFGDLTIAEDGNWTYTPFDLDSDLVAHWTFDEASGSVARDVATNDAEANDLTLQDGALLVDGGVSGGAIEFNGGAAKAGMSDSEEINIYSGTKNQYTISLEFQLGADNDLSGRQVLYEQGGVGNGYSIYIDNGTLYTGAWSGSTGWDGSWISTDISGLDSSQWHQVALVLNADNNRLEAWVDGESIGSSTASPMNYHSDDSSFGGMILSTKFHDSGSVSSENYGFNGRIDEARLYDRALSHQEINALGQKFESDNYQDVFNYTVSDGTDTSSSTLTIDVNRVPEALNGALLATEDGGAIVGQLEAIDHDTGDTLTFSVETQPAEGSVTINADGSYSFNPGADFQDLAQGATRDVTFDYRVTDAQGDFSTATVTVTVTGVNDAAVISGDSAGTLTEDTAATLTATGTLTVTDDDSEEDSFTAETVTGTYGSLTIDENGNWSYSADNSQAAIQVLGDGDSLTDTITVQSVDGTTKDITVTINGINDIAVISGADAASTTEDDAATLTASGKLDVTDADNGEAVFSAEAVTGTYGSLTIDADGNWSYEADNTQTAIQGLGDGDSLTDTITVQSVDGTTKDITVTINGINDIAVISGADAASITEDDAATLTTSGKLDITDVDTGEAAFSAGTVTGTYGSLTIDADGNWSYEADNTQTAIQGLGDGDSLTDTITVQSVDGTTKDITVTINGINDIAVISGADAASITEDDAATLTASGKLDITDADTGEAAFSAETITGTYGSLTIDADGNWSYEADNTQTAIQALGDGDSLTDTIMVQSVDGTIQDITVTINGINDIAVISGADAASITEDDATILTASGKLDITDVDTGETVFSAETLTGTYGNLTIDADGNWNYSADNSQSAIQALGDGDSLTETITVKSFDNTTHDIVITINGTNDAAAISGVDTGSVVEDWVFRDSLVSSTADKNMVTTVGETVQVTLSMDQAVTVNTDQGTPSVSISVGGETRQAVYVPENNSGNLVFEYTVQPEDIPPGETRNTGATSHTSTGNWESGVGDTKYFDFDFGSEKTFSEFAFSGTGVNGSGVITLSEVQLILSDGTVAPIDSALVSSTSDSGIRGTYNLVDGIIDVSGDYHATDGVSGGRYLDLGADGSTITFNESLTAVGLRFYTDLSIHSISDRFPESLTVELSPTVSVIDDSFALNGAQLMNSDGSLINELRAEGVLDVSDTDTGESSFIAETVTGNYGSLIINTNGSWSYSPDHSQSAIQALGDGDSLIDTITVQSVDGSTQDITVSINGTNDVAVIGGTDAASITEDDAATLTASGKLDVTDVDTGEAMFSAETVTGTYGSLTIDADGNWSYEADNTQTAIQRLGDSDNLTDTITVQSVDGTTKDITVTINGINDIAVISGADAASITEDDAAILTASGKLDVTDVDTGEAVFSAETVTGTYGSLTIDADGNWSYEADNAQAAIQALGDDDSLLDTMVIQSLDGTTHSIEVTINGVNDAAVTTQVSLQGAEDTVLTITKDQLLAGASDVEGDALSISDVSYSGSDGTLTEVGKLVFGGNTDNNIELVDRLESFNAFSLEFEYTSTGSHSGDVNAIISMATPSHSNSLMIGASNSDGSLRVLTHGSSSSTSFSEININDGATHHIVITWDSDTGDIKLFDNNQLLATKTAAQNVTIPSDGWLIIGQEQDSYGGGFDAEQSLTNAELGHITLSYDAMSQSDIEAGVSVAEGSTNLALNLRSENGQLVDTANGYTVTTAGSVTQSHDHYEFSPGSNFSGTVALDYTISDGTDTTAAQATLNFTAAGDAAVITGTDTGSVTEDAAAALTATGKLDIADADTGEAFFSAETLTGTYGDLTIDTDGNWSYSADNNQSAIQALGDGDSLTETITVKSFDNTTHNIAITISGTNDAAIIGGIDTASITEDDAATLTASGKLDITDVDTGEAAFSAETLTGTYGDLTIDADGNWSYEADNTQAAIQTLGDGDNLTDTITVQSVDGTTKDITVTINGINDIAVISGADAASITEDDAATLTASGKLDITDADTGEAMFSAETVTGTYGSLTIDADGNWSYEADNTQTAIQGLGDGDSLTDTITVQSVDGTTKDITVTINGINDIAVISGADAASITEDDAATLTASGKLDITDADTGEAVFSAGAVTGTYGSLTIDADGNWSYEADNTQTAIQALGEGDNLTDTITVQSVDGTTKDITVTINGINDIAVISGADAASITEDAAATLTASGKLDITDADNGEAVFSAEIVTGTYGSLTIDADGNWSYEADNTQAAIQTLGDGDNLTDTITVQSVGGTTQDITVTINGINDIAVISGADAASITEDDAATLTASGKLDVTDADNGEAVFSAEAVTGTYGSLTIDADGNWSYEADNTQTAIQGLGDGDSLTDTITVQSVDGTTKDITVTINGINDIAVISGADAASITEDDAATLTASGKLDITDADNGEAVFSAETVTGTYGSLTIDADGNWSYEADNTQTAIQGLGDGDSLTDTITVQSVDGTTKDITVTINGINDIAVISGADAASITEDDAATLTASGKLDITDADTGEAAFSAETITGTYGSLTIDADGNWSYEADNTQTAIQALGDGDSLTDTITVQSVDGTIQDITVTINGINDIAVISGADAASITEDDATILTASGKLDITDVDTGETVFSAETLTGTYGNLTIDADGNWNYSADNSQSAIQALGDGDSLTETITVKSFDNTTHDIVITINGTNDAAAISGVDTGSVVEDWVFRDSLVSSTADKNMVTTVGETVQVTLSMDQAVTVNTDQGTPSVSISVGGETRQAVYVPENNSGNLVFEYTVQPEDIPPGETRNTGATSHTSTGNWESGVGDTKYFDFDFGSEKTFSEFAFSGTGVNGSGVITLSEVQLILSDGTVAPIDSALVSSTSDSGIRGTYNLVDGIIDVSGDYHATDGVSGGRYLDLGADGSTITFNESLTAVGLRFYTDLSIHSISDRFPESLTVELSPTVSVIDDSFALNGAQLMNSDGSLINELRAEGVLDVSDTDTGESSFIAETVTGNYGSLIINTNGSWSYSPDHSQSAIQALGDGDSLIDTITVQSVDGSTQDITVSINGTNDVAVIGGTDAASITEDDAATLTASGKLDVTDVDTGEAMFSAETVTGTYGSLTIDADGNWSYEADNTQTAIQRLGDSDNLTDTITVQSVDGTTKDITVTINGINDIAVISGADAASITEDDAAILTASGKLDVTDVDTGEAVFSAETVTGTYGSLTIDADGNWSYEADNAQAAIQALGDDDSLLDTMVIQSLDGTTHSIEVTINGVNDAAVTTQVSLQGAEDTVLTITKDQLLAGASDVEGDALSISDVSYSGSDGTLTEVGKLVFGGNTDNNIELVDRLESFNAFSLEFEYTSTGSHSGDVNAIISMATPSHSNSLMIGASNSDGSLRVLTHGSSSSTSFSEININDGATHHIVITWDSDTGDIKLFDNNQLLATKTAAQNVTIPSDGWLIIGQEQDSYGGGFDAEQSLTNAELGHITLSYDAMSQSDIEAGVSVAEGSTNLALNLRSENGQLVDTANGYTVTTAGSVTQSHDHYEFSPGSNFSGTVALDYTISDGTDTTAAQATLNFTAAGDAAVITGTDTGSVTEDAAAALTATGKLDIADADTGEAFFSAETLTGTYGDLTIDTDGNWSYSADNNQSAIQVWAGRW